MKLVRLLLTRVMRTAVILLMVVFAATALVRFAPGYLSDAREMDQRYAGAAREELNETARRDSSLLKMVGREIDGWSRGDLGDSRQYQVPVRELIGARLKVTIEIILRAIGLAWSMAFVAALISSSRRKASVVWQLPATLLLAVPTAALATLCIVAGDGTSVYPVTVMALLLAARDFKFLDRIFRTAWNEPHVLQARAQGISGAHLLRAYILPGLRPSMMALATLSILTALSAMVPVEVIFNIPGIGQLAWSAAMNRDLPVLLAVTLINAIAVTLAGMFSRDEKHGRTESMQTMEWKAS